MPDCKGCKSKRKHTPIVSKKQQALFGAELSKAKKHKSRQTDMSIGELTRHLNESAGKKLPARHKKRGK